MPAMLDDAVGLNDFHQSRDRSGMGPPKVADLVRSEYEIGARLRSRSALRSGSVAVGTFRLRVG
jgi:hypothetical protein